MMILIPKYYKEIMPSSWVENHPALHKGFAGATIAIFESLVTCPMERIKCQLMTQHE
jgi:solute carrier family 25 carnitine/acylcarnitine transporter 20/29